MGVMGCDRRGCENIMCDKYSGQFGYICNECFAEMVKSGLDIETFMNSEKSSGPCYDYENEFTEN